MSSNATDRVEVSEPTFEEQVANPELIEDSQEAAGEEAQPEAQRPEWLPEKFSSPEDMAKAYGELEKKLGSKKADPKDLKVNEQPVEVTPEGNPKSVLGDELFGKVEEHWQEHGELSEDLYKELQDVGLSKQVVDSYIEGQSIKAERYKSEVTEVVGGIEAYSQMQEWAVDNLSDSEKDALNEAVTSGNVAKAQMAVQWLQQKYQANEGNPPKLVEGTPASVGSVFENQEEYIHAISDSRYETDPRYRREVDQKLERSTYWQ